MTQRVYTLGEDYRLYINTSTNVDPYGNAAWVEMPQIDSLSFEFNPADISIPERTTETGHLVGRGDPSISFTMFEDQNSTLCEDMIDATRTGAMVHLAVSRGDITQEADASTGTLATKYYHMECVVSGGLSADQGSASSYDITATRWANSENGLVRATVTS